MCGSQKFDNSELSGDQSVAFLQKLVPDEVHSYMGFMRSRGVTAYSEYIQYVEAEAAKRNNTKKSTLSLSKSLGFLFTRE